MHAARLQAAFDHLIGHRYAAARDAFLAMVARTPADAHARAGLAAAFAALNEPAKAKFHALEALRLAPHDERLTIGAAQSLVKAGDAAHAVKVMEQARSSHATWYRLRGALGVMYDNLGQLADAEACLRECLAGDPTDYLSRLGLANVFASQGRADDAWRAMQAIAAEGHADQHLLEAMAGVSSYVEAITPSEAYKAHAELGRFFAMHAPSLTFSYPATDDPSRTLRVALVSHDFNDHAVAHFLRPLLAHLRRDDLRVIGVHSGLLTDAVTTQLRAHCDEFLHMPQVNSADLATRLHAAKIDIAIDVNGWTTGHRLAAFATKFAPVLMTYLGYPHSTGIPNIDYRIVDSITDPAGSERFASESLLQLDPCFLCYAPVFDRADMQGWTRLARRAGPITFASCNAAKKISEGAITAWARVLARVPDARLVIKGRGLSQEGTQAALRARLEQAGIPHERCDIMGQAMSNADHFSTLASFDIALDAFPYNGTTTTCELLSVGVPVVTILGNRHVARVGASLLHQVGLGELVAPDIDGYVDRAVALAHDTSRLAQLRASLPQRVLASPLCDGKAYADRCAAGLRSAWKTRCERGVRDRT